MSDRTVRVAGGGSLALQPRSSAARTETGYLFTGPRGAVAVDADVAGVLSPQTASELVSQGFLAAPGSTLFEQPALCRAVFGWDPTIEVDGLQRLLGAARDTRGLDVGCGYGGGFCCRCPAAGSGSTASTAALRSFPSCGSMSRAARSTRAWSAQT